MRELKVVMSDDLIYTQTGERVPADETVVISLDGRTRELDLTASNATMLRETITPFLDVGHAPGGDPSGGRKQGRRTPTSAIIANRARQKQIRDWADARGLRSTDGKRPIYLTKGGGYYYPQRLMKMYKAHLATQARDDDGHRNP